MEKVNDHSVMLDADLVPSLDANVGTTNGSPGPSSNADDASGACANEIQIAVGARFDAGNVTTFTRQYIEASNLEVRFDGTLSFKGDLLRADTPAEIAAFLDTEQLTERDVLDRMVLFAFNEQYELKKNVIEPALRQELSRLRRARYNMLMKPLLRKEPASLIDDAQGEWARLGSLFNMRCELAAAVVGHFI